ncbi:MAG: hypothetical protein J0I53_02075 [Chryseobacterium sp.]|nr:hypothetical protein [Chryseobacterium sp.]
MEKKKVLSVTLYNTKGFAVKTFKKLLDVNLNGLTPGLYLLAVEQLDHQVRRQLIQIM